jgi:hypothetical protein
MWMAVNILLYLSVQDSNKIIKVNCMIKIYENAKFFAIKFWCYWYTGYNTETDYFLKLVFIYF